MLVSDLSAVDVDDAAVLLDAFELLLVDWLEELEPQAVSDAQRTPVSNKAVSFFLVIFYYPP